MSEKPRKGNLRVQSRARALEKASCNSFEANELCRLHHGDTRLLSRRLPQGKISVTITSPPYFDLKNYDVNGQIGYGQSYEAYLGDLATVFGEVHRATRNKGSLWIVIDTFRRGQEVLPLPFDLAAKLRTVGWRLRDVIIWKKDRTLPWIHEGKTRKIFEYILVFAKSDGLIRYHTDRVRDNGELRKWWVKYPERYNPGGKALEEIWNFDIPVQGSWDIGQKQIRHSCPLPSSLIKRILDLTTSKGDIVLDPFAGSGAVLVEAQAASRRAVGFELNYTYIRRFKAFLARKNSQVKRGGRGGRSGSENFKSVIQKLRLLKFGRLLFRGISHAGGKRIEHVFVRKLGASNIPPHKLYAAEYLVYAPKIAKAGKVHKRASEIACKKPLSKFGIEAHIRVIRKPSDLPKAYRSTSLFCYSSTNSHFFNTRLPLSKALESRFPVISLINARVEVPDD